MQTFRTQNLLELLQIIYQDIADQKDLLTQLDAVTGDGDLGVNMELGFRAILEGLKKEEDLTLNIAFSKCALLFNDAAPSTLGTVISSGFMAFAASMENPDNITRAQFADMMEAAMSAMSDLGGAHLGDKTILDSMRPFTEALKEHLSEPYNEAWKIVAEKTREAAEHTANMVPKIGRARMYGEKSLGICDGGAVVFSIIAQSMEKYFTV